MSLSSLSFSDAFYQLGDSFYTRVRPQGLTHPCWVHINPSAIELFGLSPNHFQHENNLTIVSGQAPLAQQTPLAMVYSGHQFGHYSPQLGDGRALLLGQVNSGSGLMDIQLKGAGKTPYSRFGDGRAVLRASIREYLAGEALHHLGVPTTRALCLVGSDDPVIRETVETAAIVTRIAKTHIRFGHFEYFHYRGQYQQVKQLADYVMQHLLPAVDIIEQPHHNTPYAALLHYAVTSTATLIAQWQALGFVHGVMNTDNMSILGETLDYGPYGFLDDYNPQWISNHSDTTGRYSFDQQPTIGFWNLNALAHALSSLIDTDTRTAILSTYEPTLTRTYSTHMRRKLGLRTAIQQDHQLCHDLLSLMAEDRVDYHYFFRQLCTFQCHPDNPRIADLFQQQSKWQHWCRAYQHRLAQEDTPIATRQAAMKQANPKFIARNYLLQNAIERAQSHRDFSEIHTLFTLLQTPFAEHPDHEHYSLPSPDWGKQLNISCSS